MRTYPRIEAKRALRLAVPVFILALLGGLLASGAGAARKGAKLPRAGKYAGKVGNSGRIRFNYRGRGRVVVRLTAAVNAKCVRTSNGYFTETKNLATWPAEQKPRAVLKVRKFRPEGDRRWYWGFSGAPRDKGGAEWSIVGRFVSRTKARGTFQVRRLESIADPLEPADTDEQLCNGFGNWAAVRNGGKKRRRAR
jgi:hypothetical protein